MWNVSEFHLCSIIIYADVIGELVIIHRSFAFDLHDLFKLVIIEIYVILA